jgi:hypothetical protein
VWWQHTELRKAQARGDQETVTRLQAEMDAQSAARASSISTCLASACDNGAKP